MAHAVILLLGIGGLVRSEAAVAQEADSVAAAKDTVRARASLGSPDQVDNQLEPTPSRRIR